MIRKIMAEIDVKIGVQTILSRVNAAYAKRSQISKSRPLLVAVSKTKPIQMILDVYSTGQLHFGENYVKELEEKGHAKQILEQCRDIRWHFIGHLQTNKINKVLNIPNIYMIETIDSEKLATSVNVAWGKIKKADADPLKILIQINTSDEDEKNGLKPSQAVQLYRHVLENCPNLRPEGLMTIGKFGHDYSTGPNPDFVTLLKCQEDVCNELNLNKEDVNLSMGMSDDFEQAIEMGSTIVRVGSSIFGYRPKKVEHS